MKYLALLNRTRYSMLGNRIVLADTLFGRLRGFLFRPEPRAGEGLILNPCRAVHMYGIRFSLDILFVNAQGTVVAMHKRLAPGARTPFYRDAEYAIELPAGVIEASRTQVDDVLVWHPVPAQPVVHENGAKARSDIVAGPEPLSAFRHKQRRQEQV